MVDLSLENKAVNYETLKKLYTLCACPKVEPQFTTPYVVGGPGGSMS